MNTLFIPPSFSCTAQTDKIQQRHFHILCYDAVFLKPRFSLKIPTNRIHFMMQKNKLPTLLLAVISAGLLTLTACGDKADSTKNGTASEVVESSGNWKAKPSELSSANASDIKADLAVLNPIVNQSNEKGIAILKEIQQAKDDQAKIKTLVAKSMKIQFDNEQQILNLNLKSSEVQSIRIQMIDSTATAKQLFDMFNQPSFDMKNPDAQFQALSKRSMAIQQRIGLELDALNQKHP